MENIGLNYLNENPQNNVLLITRYFDSEIIYESKDGVILKDGDAYYISFRNKEVAEPVLNKYSEIKKGYYTVNDFVNEIYNKNPRVFYQYHYVKKEKVKLDNYDIRVLDVSYLDFVCKYYDLIEEYEVKEHLENGDLIGLFENDKLTGFIGTHHEESMGMLFVLEEYRGKGYAYALEGSLINKLLDENRIIYCHVLIDNEASKSLQSKLGLIKDDNYVYWCFD